MSASFKIILHMSGTNKDIDKVKDYILNEQKKSKFETEISKYNDNWIVQKNNDISFIHFGAFCRYDIIDFIEELLEKKSYIFKDVKISYFKLDLELNKYFNVFIDN